MPKRGFAPVSQGVFIPKWVTMYGGPEPAPRQEQDNVGGTLEFLMPDGRALRVHLEHDDMRSLGSLVAPPGAYTLDYPALAAFLRTRLDREPQYGEMVEFGKLVRERMQDQQDNVMAAVFAQTQDQTQGQPLGQGKANTDGPTAV